LSKYDEKLDIGIRPLVLAIRKIGLPTWSSCEGHLESKETHYPYVCFEANIPANFPKNFLILRLLLKKWNSKRSLKWCLVDKKPYPWIELRPKSKNSKRYPQILQKLQEEAKELARFFSAENITLEEEREIETLLKEIDWASKMVPKGKFLEISKEIKRRVKEILNRAS